MNYTLKELASMNGSSKCEMGRRLEDTERDGQFLLAEVRF